MCKYKVLVRAEKMKDSFKRFVASASRPGLTLPYEYVVNMIQVHPTNTNVAPVTRDSRICLK